MSNRNPFTAKKNITIRWRKKKNLCLICGQDPHEGDCIEIYDKADMRTLGKPVKVLNEDKRKDTIISYRKKKLLCLRCGQMVHAGECRENYEKSDMRPPIEKTDDPRIVITPKINIFDRKEEVSTIDLKQTQRTKYNRDFIFIDIRPNDKYKNRITFIDIRYLAKRFSNCIICVNGCIDKLYPYAELLEMKKIINLVETKNENNIQEIVNYIYGCKYYISFESDLTRFAKQKRIPCISLNDEDDIRNVLSKIPKMKND